MKTTPDPDRPPAGPPRPEDLLVPHLLGDLDPAQSARVRAHLADRPDRAQLEEDLNATLALLTDTLAEHPQPAAAKPALSVLPPLKRREHRQSHLLPLRLIAQAAAIALFLGGSIALVRWMKPDAMPATNTWPVGEAVSPAAAALPLPEGEVQSGPVTIRPPAGYGVDPSRRDGLRITNATTRIDIDTGLGLDLLTAGTSEQVLGDHRFLVDPSAPEEAPVCRLSIVPANAEFGTRPSVYPINILASGDSEVPAATVLLDMILTGVSIQVDEATEESARVHHVQFGVAEEIVKRGNVAGIEMEGDTARIKGRDGFDYIVDGVEPPTVEAWLTR